MRDLFCIDLTVKPLPHSPFLFYSVPVCTPLCWFWLSADTSLMEQPAISQHNSSQYRHYSIDIGFVWAWACVQERERRRRKAEWEKQCNSYIMCQAEKNNIDRNKNSQGNERVAWSDGVSPLFLEVHHTNLSPKISPPLDGSVSIVRELFPTDR